MKRRMAIVGLGLALKPHALSVRDLAGRLEIAAAWSPSEARRAEAGRQHGWPTGQNLEAILADPTISAVALLTPPNTHLELVSRCAAAGKHVLLEKPLEIATGRAEAMAEVAARHALTVGVVLQHRFRPAGERLAQILKSGGLGEIVNCSTTIRLWRPQSYYDQPGRGTRARDGGGVLLTQGIHTLDLMLSLAGPVAEVRGYAATSRMHRMETEDMVVAGVRFASGALGVIDATTAAYPGFSERIEIAGTNGTAVLAGSSLLVQTIDGGREEMKADGQGGGTGASPMDFPHDWHRGVWTDFLDALDAGRRPRVDLQEALKVHRLIDALLEAGVRGGPVQVAGD